MSTLRRTITISIASILVVSCISLAQSVFGQEQPGVQATGETNVGVNTGQEGITALATVESTPMRVSSTNQPAASTFVRKDFWPNRTSSPGPILVVPSAEIETKDLLTINEDMNVMSRIFENNLRESRVTMAGSGSFFPSIDSSLMTLLGRGGPAIQGMYLQGYGALFLMKVDFPLSAPPQTPQKDETDNKGKTDDIWEQTRKGMYEPEQVVRSRRAEKQQEYDPKKVENLKTTLVKSLKHAANIRILKPDESIVITVTGGGDFRAITTRRTVVVNGRGKILQEPASVAAGSPTVLVIRAKKADIDGFAKGDFDLDQFRQRVQILSYPLLGGAIGSGDATDAVGDDLMLNDYKLGR